MIPPGCCPIQTAHICDRPPEDHGRCLVLSGAVGRPGDPPDSWAYREAGTPSPARPASTLPGEQGRPGREGPTKPATGLSAGSGERCQVRGRHMCSRRPGEHDTPFLCQPIEVAESRDPIGYLYEPLIPDATRRPAGAAELVPVGEWAGAPSEETYGYVRAAGSYDGVPFAKVVAKHAPDTVQLTGPAAAGLALDDRVDLIRTRPGGEWRLAGDSGEAPQRGVRHVVGSYAEGAPVPTLAPDKAAAWPGLSGPWDPPAAGSAYAKLCRAADRTAIWANVAAGSLAVWLAGEQITDPMPVWSLAILAFAGTAIVAGWPVGAAIHANRAANRLREDHWRGHRG